MLQRYVFFEVCLILIITVIALGSCKKFVQVDTPLNRVAQGNIFTTDKTAITVVNGIYTDFYTTGVDITEYMGLLSDELNLWSDGDMNRLAHYSNTLVSVELLTSGQQFWISYFNSVYKCNAAIEGLSISKSISAKVKSQLLGELFFFRAFYFFYLTNIYGDIPLPLSSDPEINRLLPRESKEKVFNVILDNLLSARELLSEDYLDGKLTPYSNGFVERVRITKWAATAFIARIYLYLKKWSLAEAESDKLIRNSAKYKLVSLGDVFLKNNNEAIWQIQPIAFGYNTAEGRRFNLKAAPLGFSLEKQVFLSSWFLKAIEPGDRRFAFWIDSLVDASGKFYFSSKYKLGELDPAVSSTDGLREYCVVLRLAEMYLIRAESRANQDKLLDAISDLDTIRARAFLPSIRIDNPILNKEALLEKISNERRVEFNLEWGHRWFDLKRLGKVNGVMSVVTPTKSGVWDAHDEVSPIPFEELRFNPNFKQNPGY